MKKITFLIATLLVTTLSFGQVVMEPLWEFSSQNGNLADRFFYTAYRAGSSTCAECD
ncbi:MAG: hypothetical protein ACK5KP_08115 [Paludibacteraceae bacterium]